MSLQYVIDGYNITHHAAFSKNIKNGNGTAAALARLIRSKRLCGKNNAIIVFDGFPPASEAFPDDSVINFLFSKSHSADEKIKSIVENSPNRKNIIVVSDDNEIRFIVKALGAKVMGVEDFINPPSKRKHQKNISTEIELSFSQMEDINEELRKIWLK